MSLGNRTLLALRKNSREEIRITLSEYRGARYVDIRMWFEPREGGEKKPSREGVAVRPEMLPDVLRALQDAVAELEALS